MRIAFNAELQTKIKAEVSRWIEVANNHYKPALPFTMPRVRFDLRGTTAGWAKWQKWEVNFNAVLLIENYEDFIATTVPHEVAHLIDGIQQDRAGANRTYVYTSRFGRRRRSKRDIHGDSWRAVMKVFGIVASARCHDYDTTNSRVGNRIRYEYTCHCPGKIMRAGNKIHTHIQLGNAKKYYERACKHRFTAADWKRPEQLKPTVAAPVVWTTPPPVPKFFEPRQTGTKLDQVIRLMREYPSTTSRAHFIELIMLKCNMSKAGASTYYYKGLETIKRAQLSKQALERSIEANPNAAFLV